MSAGNKFRVAGRRKRWKGRSEDVQRASKRSSRAVLCFRFQNITTEGPVRGVSLLASDKSLPRSRKTPFDLGCSRDTSRGCVGRRCTVLSYTFRSHPYQNTVERGCCSKVFFGLRNNDAGLREPAIHPEGNAIFGYDGGNHFVRNGILRLLQVFSRLFYISPSNNHYQSRYMLRSKGRSAPGRAA